MKKITESILDTRDGFSKKNEKSRTLAAALKNIFIHLFDCCFFKP